MQHRKFPRLLCCLLFIIHVLSPPSETLLSARYRLFSNGREVSGFYKWQSASLSLSLDKNLHTTFIVRLTVSTVKCGVLWVVALCEWKMLMAL